MNEDDIGLRNLSYARFVELGRAPTADEIGAASGRDRAEVISGWERLHVEHALVLNRLTGDITMANPFSGVPTAYRVQAGHRMRVQVSGGAFPRFARNLGTAESLASATKGLLCRFDVYHDARHPACVVLPVLT